MGKLECKCLSKSGSSTENSHKVALQSMKTAQRIAEESGNEEMSIAYDLAIAKLALQIQAGESARFNNVII